MGGTLAEDVDAAVQMWKSWGVANNDTVDPLIAQNDIDSKDLQTQLWPSVLAAMHDHNVNMKVVEQVTKVHPKDLQLHKEGTNSTVMWKWYAFWLQLYSEERCKKLVAATENYEILQQYTCKVISQWMNIKYGVCILAATVQRHALPKVQSGGETSMEDGHRFVS